MFRQSIWMVLAIVLLVFITSTWNQWQALGQLPSAYDPGIQIQEAFQTSEHPLLVEFYSDECRSCRQATPLLHKVYNTQFQDQLTLVMLDVNDANSAQVAQLFGVEAIPAVYVFDAKHMHKEVIPLSAFEQEKTLRASVEEALLASQNNAAGASGSPS